jgi:hypothetical protein
MDLRLATLKAVSFYLQQNVSTLNKCRKLSCVTVVCEHFASYNDYPNKNGIYFGSLRFKGDEVNGVVASMERRDKHHMVSDGEIRKIETT